MEFFNNHTKLFTTAFLLFVGLTLFVCIIPALDNQTNNEPLPFAQALSEEAIKGKAVFIANGCVACHTQQVRNVDMDKVWGERPSIAADYADNYRTDFWRNTATLMGTERTGPDLTNIGSRQPSREWQLSHLFNPRIVVKESIMPAYTWMFEVKDKLAEGDVSVSVPEEFMNGQKGKVVAKEEAMQLVAYLQALKQTKLPGDAPKPAFLYKKTGEPNAGSKPGATKELNGAMLYTNNCQSCHQQNGEGLKGAFPPLKGSKIVLDENPELFVDIIMNGYSGREKEGFGVMPAVGTNNRLKAEEVTAIMNHERTSWGNNGKKVTLQQVQKLMEKVKATGK
ncbi:cytochrome c [Pedobacter ginsengisoli]|uniref:cytochrome c n=1 Tax=Pedobacter ginsengisoli TaxID=363852 RepID=UPI0025513F52|nr:cbb3-type cytochrome c oxidase subunit II [Pedobacter ginsengisoli]